MKIAVDVKSQFGLDEIKSIVRVYSSSGKLIDVQDFNGFIAACQKKLES
jgi:hypothetical protein